jgi:pimeloyl-ACP methyl ester carboxylesterase
MTTWILLRGLTREIGHWGGFPARLRAELPEQSVVAIDLPGAGALHWLPSPMSIRAIAGHCRDQARSLGLVPPYGLVGLSLGAMVAAAWSEAWPEEVAAAALINTSLGSLCPPWQRLRPRNYAALMRLLLPANDRQRETIIFRLTSNRPEQAHSVIRDWTDLRHRHPVSAGNALRQLWASVRYRPAAPPNGARLLVLASLGDRLVDPDCSRRLAQAWHADYAEHPTAGHDLPLDDGDWVAGQIGRWWHNAGPGGH